MTISYAAAYRHVYFAKPVGQDGPIKIGCSNDVVQRIAQMSMWSPVPLELIACFPGKPSDEHALHREFAEYRLHGEWFSPGERLLKRIDAFLPEQAA